MRVTGAMDDVDGYVALVRIGLRGELKQAVDGGLAAGFVGGAVLVLLFVLQRSMVSGDAWVVLKMLTGPILGSVATAPGFHAGAALLGTFLHFAVAAAWGAVFGVLAYGRTAKHMTILAGAAFGVVVWVVMFYLALPIWGATSVRSYVSVLGAIIGHIAYGAAMGASFIPFQKGRHGEEPSFGPAHTAPP